MKSSKIKFYGFIGVLMVIFAFTDLSISKQIYNPESSFGIFFEIFGEMPMTLVGVFSGVALIATYEKRNNWVDYANHIGFGILTFFNAFMGGFLLSTYLKFSMPVVALITAGYILLGVLFVKMVSKGYYKELRQVAKVGILLSFLAILIINVIKIFWGRERLRHMSAPYSGFTAWYLPQSMTTNNEFMSFPSGHSANSAIVYMITLLPLFIPKLKKYTTHLTVFAVVWFVLVMISRIVVGAHFASDVTMGMTISLSTFWFLKHKFVKGE